MRHAAPVNIQLISPGSDKVLHSQCGEGLEDFRNFCKMTYLGSQERVQYIVLAGQASRVWDCADRRGDSMRWR